MSPRAQAILIGGAFLGVLSALPIVSIANCCCLWLVGGGAVTAYLIQQGQPDPISLSDGSVGGFLAGVFGAVVYTIVTIPVQMLTGPIQEEIAEALRGSADVPPDVVELFDQFSGAGPLATLVAFVVILLAGMVFSTLGGLLGAVVFRRNRPIGTPVAPDA
jgi:hypothetical protein